MCSDFRLEQVSQPFLPAILPFHLLTSCIHYCVFITFSSLSFYLVFVNYVFLQGVSIAASPVLAIVGKPSVCLSVCLSHAGTE